MSDINRRNLLKRVGAAAGVSAAGIGSVQAETDGVSSTEADATLDHDVSEAALERADVDPESLVLAEAANRQIKTEQWVQIPIDGDAEHFAYNANENVAEVKAGSDVLVRARRDDDQVAVEALELGDEVTAEAMETLAASDEWDEMLEERNVASVETADAAAHRDLESGITRVFVSAELADGVPALLVAEIAQDDSLASVHAVPGDTGGISTQDSAFDCWVNCITWGTFCMTPCQVCVADPTRVSCAPCAVCIGGTAGGCAAKCGLEQFW